MQLTSHSDHIGRFAYLISNGYKNAIYCTELSSLFMPLTLLDCYKNNSTEIHYTLDDVYNTINLIQSIPFNTLIKVSDGITLTLFP